jgi:hypothetical protein
MRGVPFLRVCEAEFLLDPGDFPKGLFIDRVELEKPNGLIPGRPGLSGRGSPARACAPKNDVAETRPTRPIFVSRKPGARARISVGPIPAKGISARFR